MGQYANIYKDNKRIIELGLASNFTHSSFENNSELELHLAKAVMAYIHNGKDDAQESTEDLMSTMEYVIGEAQNMARRWILDYLEEDGYTVRFE